LTQKKPNILWICTDQQRFDTLGSSGNTFVKTPNLDNLADESANFTNSFVQSPICMPSRASFLTGRYPRTTRLRQNGQTIPIEERPISRILRDAGYYCGLAGKFHLSPSAPEVNETIERRFNDGYNEFNWAGDPQNQWGNHSGYSKFLHDSGQKFKTTIHPDCKYIEIGMPKAFHETTWCANTAIEFIKRQSKNTSPWMFSMNMFAPHHPFNPPMEMLERYISKIESIPLPNAFEDDLSLKPPYQNIDSKGAYGQTLPYHKGLSTNDHRMIRAAYWAMCDLVDDAVGNVLDALERSGQKDDTIVIFMSDHGEMLGDHGIYLKGPYFYDPAIRVPFMMRYPRKITPGEKIGLTELVDVVPTLLEACDLEIHEGIQGQSLWNDLAINKQYTGRDSVYCEYYNAMPHQKTPKPQLTMIRTEEFKLIVDHTNDCGELYHLTENPSETINYWSDKNFIEIKSELLTQLTHRMAFTVDPLPKRIADW